MIARDDPHASARTLLLLAARLVFWAVAIRVFAPLLHVGGWQAGPGSDRAGRGRDQLPPTMCRLTLP